MDTIFHRISVRKFTEQKVEQEKIEKILSAGMQAPSAANQQPWEFYVVTNQELLKKLSTSSPYAGPAAGAPAAIVSVYRKDCRLPEYAQILTLGSVEVVSTANNQKGADATRTRTRKSHGLRVTPQDPSSVTASS